ncbi:MAG TPA: LysR family transcriptional regulator [Fibrobacteria bacterium]|nr:LysR family transcriptional regulator [Fibrobacteria bacterium]
MNLVQVRMFCLSATLGSLSDAARAMGITQSAVSKGLSRLQEEEGVRLFETSRGKLALTPAGEAFLPFARRILEQETLADRCLRDFRQGEVVSILTSETFGIYYLPPAVRRLRERWPATRVRVDLAHNANIEDRVARGTHDVGILSRPGRNAALDYFHLLDDELALVCAAGHELSNRTVEAAELSGRSFILHEAGSVPRQIAEEFLSRHSLSVDVPMEVSNVESMKVLVREDAGFAFLSRRSALAELESGSLGEVGIAGERLSRGFYLVHRRDRETSLPVRRLYHTLRRGGEGPVEAIHDGSSRGHDGMEEAPDLDPAKATR